MDSEPSSSDGMKTFFHANQAEHPELRKYMAAVEVIEKLLKNMTFTSLLKVVVSVVKLVQSVTVLPVL